MTSLIVKYRSPVLTLFFVAILFIAPPTIAATKVVVIPMAGDVVEIMPAATSPLAKNSPLDSDYTISGTTVIDNVTSLEWQRTYDNGTDIKRSWDNAYEYCIDLELDSKTDWRLPLMEELVSIVNYDASSPAINVVAFPSTNIDQRYWSATNVANSSNKAMTAFFFLGHTERHIKSSLFYVRCVR